MINSGSKKSPDKTSGEAASVSSADVTLSSLASTLAAAETEAAPVNLEKVSQLKAAIAEGQFKIGPERIADQLLKMAKEFAQGKLPV